MPAQWCGFPSFIHLQIPHVCTSFANTFLNASYTLFLEILVLIIYIPTMGYENLKAWGINTLSLFLMIPMIVISIIFMSVVSCMDMCSF